MGFLEVTSQLLIGFETTFLLFILTLIFALPLGLLMAFCTTSKFAPLRILFKVIVWVLRGTPLLLQLFVICYIPGWLNLFQWPTVNTGWAWFDQTITTRFIVALVAFSINYAAYFSEIYRGGIENTSNGQFEAGQVLGMTKRQIFFKVILLQVIKKILAPMSNEVITLVKDTSLANSIATYELIFRANKFMNVGLIWPFLYAGAFYLLFVGILTIIFNKTEKKLSYFKA